jgi:hypothetical protein
LQWLQDPSEIDEENLNHIRRETRQIETPTGELLVPCEVEIAIANIEKA